MLGALKCSYLFRVKTAVRPRLTLPLEGRSVDTETAASAPLALHTAHSRVLLEVRRDRAKGQTELKQMHCPQVSERRSERQLKSAPDEGVCA